MLIKNHLQLSERIYKRKRIADAYRVEEIDVDSYFFYNLLDVFTQNKNIIRFSTAFDYTTFSIKKFDRDEYIKQSCIKCSSHWVLSQKVWNSIKICLNPLKSQLLNQ